MITEPLVPIVPMGWLLQQRDLPRRSSIVTAGLVGEQPRQDWLSPAKRVIQSFTRVIFHIPRVSVEPLLSVLIWIRKYASVHRGRGLFTVVQFGGLLSGRLCYV